jgi:hypothetical protein
MLKNITLIGLLVFAQSIMAQNFDGVLFKKIKNDFGDIKEEIGDATCVFSFKNISQSPIIIDRVETSCGCTTPGYTKTEILPGDTGFIKAIYGARGRPGGFHKYLYVYFKGKPNYISLAIEGNVIASPRLEKKPTEYTTNYSNLAFTQTIASFSPIYKTEKKETKLKLYNYNGYPIKILEVKSLPDYVKLDIQDSILNVDDSLIITVKVDGSKIPKMGDQYNQITLFTDDEGMENKNIYVHTNLKEDYSTLTKEQLDKAPKLSFDRKLPIDFGKKTAGSKVKQTIKVKNDGKTDLIISKIIPSCSCITFNMSKQTLKPGESIELVIQIDTVNQTIAKHSKYLTLHTNDPKQAQFNIKLEIDITN